MQRGANANAQDRDDRTPLFFATLQGHGEIVQSLLLAICTVDVKTEGAITALITAALSNSLGVIRVLLGAGANKDLTDDRRSTSLQIAEKMGHMQIAELLRA